MNRTREFGLPCLRQHASAPTRLLYISQRYSTLIADASRGTTSMVNGTEVTRLINVDPRADRWGVSLHALILLSFAATTTYCAQAQNIEGQPIAAQYGEFE